MKAFYIKTLQINAFTYNKSIKEHAQEAILNLWNILKTFNINTYISGQEVHINQTNAFEDKFEGNTIQFEEPEMRNVGKIQKGMENKQ